MTRFWQASRWLAFGRQVMRNRRLIYAIVFSLLLHFFVIGKFYAKLPNFKTESYSIEARLVLPKVTPVAEPALEPIEPKPPVKANPKVKQSKPAKVTEPVQQPISEEAPEISEPLPPKDEVAKVTQPEPPLPPPTETVETPKVTTDDRVPPEEDNVIINADPYRYVETDFDVYVDADAASGASPAGKAKILYQVNPDTDQYQLKSLIEAKGLAALLIPDLLQTSDGLVTKYGLQPTHYLYQYGDKKNKTYSADFDWQTHTITLHGEKDSRRDELVSGTQDLLSFMYQFMFVAPLQNMIIRITNGKKVAGYEYRFEGEEMITSKMGEVKTVHLLRMAEEGEKKTELWLALEYQYVPVKIRETDKAGKVYELLARHLKTDKDITPQ